jgi:hypothetical protein
MTKRLDRLAEAAWSNAGPTPTIAAGCSSASRGAAGDIDRALETHVANEASSEA